MAIIEFAIAVPILILLIMILYECGRLYSVYLRFTDVAWQGTRFFSSLTKPPELCLNETLNLAYADNDYVTGLDAGKADYPNTFHKVIQDRVETLFLYKTDSWPIKSDLLIPGKTSSVFAGGYENMPSISTQFVLQGSPNGCPHPMGHTITAENQYTLDNTVAVCLEADYTGLFFDIPLKACSVSHLLSNNETLRIPPRPKPANTGGGRSQSGG